MHPGCNDGGFFAAWLDFYCRDLIVEPRIDKHIVGRHSRSGWSAHDS
ncbi:MAG: hypothetical protein ACI97A_003445 [Planctomycetota bacterium]|jgi:hypothetical protein